MHFMPSQKLKIKTVLKLKTFLTSNLRPLKNLWVFEETKQFYSYTVL